MKLDTEPYEYLFVEAKTSILPTPKSKFSGHRHGILKQMITSLGSYTPKDERFDLTRIRDNLRSKFAAGVAEKIRKDLVPPGPQNAKFLGIAVINKPTVSPQDDDFILVEPCDPNFDFEAIIVSNLASLAKQAYAYGKQIKTVASKANS